jgi:hypothetical protein
MPDANADVKQLSEWIAEQMGWSTLDPELRHEHILTKHENGIEMKLWLSIESGRLKVSADSMGLYTFTWREERFPTITCSLTKTPPQIARDIERRVLPEYKALLEKLLARKAVHDDRKRKQHECCQQIADVLGTEMREGQGRESDPRVYCYGKGTSAIEFSVMSDTSVRIEIRSCSFEAALQIAHTTQEWLRYGWNKANEQTMLEQERVEEEIL